MCICLHYAMRKLAQKTVKTLQMGSPFWCVALELKSGAMEKVPEKRRELDDLFSVTYEELRRLASTVRRGDPSATLSPTALVNEA